MSTVLLTQITRTGTYPAQIQLDVTYNRGFISFVTNNWTAQMFYELPAIKLDLYTDVEGTMVRSPLFSRTIKTYNPTFPLDQQCSICISMKDVPTNCYLFVTPIFDNNAIEARNELIRNGIETGTLWTTKTNTFSILLSYEDNNSIPTKTITQQPPISFTSDGTSIVSWSMLGNGQQTGTPTPDAPIMPTFCGVRTGNLWETTRQSLVAQRLVTLVDLGSDTTFQTLTIACRVDNLKAEGVFGAFLDLEMSDGSHNYIQLGALKNVTDNATIKPNVNISGDYYVTRTDVTFRKIIGYFWSTGYNKFSSGTAKFAFYDSDKKDYEPFGYKIPITCAGQTTPVYLGQVQTVRRIKKLVLTGEENITTTHTDIGLFNITVTDYLKTVGTITNICSHYRAEINVNGWSDVTDLTCRFYGNAGSPSKLLYIRDSSFSTVDDFKSYLAQQYTAGTPVTVWYVLAEPETAIVNEPLAKIGDYADELHSADAGVNIPTTKGANTLTVDGTLQPSSMTITGNIK